jgi:pyruvate,water dikinase
MPRFFPIFVPSVASLGLLTELTAQSSEGDHGVAPLVLEVTRGLPRNVTTEMDLELWKTAKAIRNDSTSLERFTSASPTELANDYLNGTLPSAAQSAIAHFMDLYGMRGVGEIDLGQSRWREAPRADYANTAKLSKNQR